MESIPWKFAFAVFGIGFGGVFACLVVLQLSINLFSMIVYQVEKMIKRSTGDK
ncbi:MAG: hypothetical protein JXC33_01800 [Deltaproteobacteria bacterium]|nr:hypothetical protein [Deltaproteobacteria bacterium]